MKIGNFEIKGIVFDLNGTLVYTNSQHRYLVVRKTLEKLGISYVGDGLIDIFWFDGDRDKIVLENFKVNPMEFWIEFDKWDTVEMRKRFTKPYYDVGIIEKIRSEGISTGILTGAPEEIKDMEIELTNQRFDVSVSAYGGNGIKEKPDPQGLIICLEKMGIDFGNAAIVGNGVEDIVVGHKMGVVDVLISRMDKIPIDVTPSYIISSLYDLVNY
jgi:phosphoglycolate phosphatase-like HAD superfamily hydrolase